jgi:hypothetical protein
MVMTNAAKSVFYSYLTLENLQLNIVENPDACITAAEIYECGMKNQMVVTYNMTEVGEGNSTKVSKSKTRFDFTQTFCIVLL